MKANNIKIVAVCYSPDAKDPSKTVEWKEEHILSVPKHTEIKDAVRHCERWFLSEKWNIKSIKGKWTSESAGFDLNEIIDEYMTN